MTYPTLKVTYLDSFGRAELTRLALHVAGIPFEDERLSWASFVALQPSLPFHQIPTLTINGEVLAQSFTMARYVGRLGGLYPTDRLAAFRVDEVLAACLDLVDLFMPSFKEPDNAKRLAMRAALSQATLPTLLACIEARLPLSGTYFLGDDLSIADLELYCSRVFLTQGYLDGIPPSIITPYGRWNAIADAVGAHPKIEAWVVAHKKK
ncbi:hypothetical protein SDRG_08823 [Saprolegnia diclina VS20]|uniref:Glutathione S-transferase n=1 Tax=Saprolegnia diclina (strain VS20) TaxID=1156394 RepID=T0QIZ3_SAPDV|nr:hypothetical protein SDRG_08823 [Saprolegnia diclina VS20]EQC33720.1 hypothetical protein SDRG_08823 [Saprolegnia diclina VS20]|eukprot:XP_008612943.1 hypothetical protein SDRG_08823 [Saprolegnia diclina VS20]